MTLVEPNPVAGPARSAAGGRAGGALARAEALWRATWTEHLVVLGLLGAVVLALAHAGGGRDAGALAGLVPLLLVALAITRVWRLGVRTVALVALVAVAALVVLAVTGGGRAAAVAAASYGTALGCGLVVAAYARTPGRRAAVAGVVCAGGVAQFAWALVPWWGQQDPTRPMVGTFDWHNQYAAALLAPALLGLGLALAGRRPWRSAGWVAAPLSVAGIVLSTSRATLGLLVVGWLAVVVLALLGADGTRARGSVAGRALVCSVVAVMLTFLLPGPPLFPTSVSPLAGSAERASSGETMASNGAFRTQFWDEALVAFRTQPASGVGYGRMAAVSQPRVSQDWAISPLAHSGPLQGLAEGGLLLALPLLALLGAVAVGLGRRLRPPARLSVPDRLVVRAAAVGGLLLGLHACIDTDWSYPALAAEAAIVTALALAVPLSPAVAVRARAGVPAVGARAAVGVLAVALVVGGALAWGQPFHISAPAIGTSAIGSSPTTSGGGHS